MKELDLSPLDDAGRGWLAQACAAAAEQPEAVLAAFPAAGRRVGRGPVDPSRAPDDVHAWSRDDLARAALLRTAARNPDRLPDLLAELYWHGDSAERRGVLRALDVLDAGAIGDAGLPLVRDALRTNDTRLIAAALGAYAAARLDDASYAQAILKCIFTGIPLCGVAGLAEHRTPELARMLAEFAHERIAAGRTVPTDVWLVLDHYPAAVADAGLVHELHSPVPERRAAAARALAGRVPSPRTES